MALKTTLRNATEYPPTDRQAKTLQDSNEPNRRRSRDDSVVKIVGEQSSLVTAGPPISSSPRSKESSQPLRSLENAAVTSLLFGSGNRKFLPQERLGNVMSDKPLSSPSTSSISVKSPNSRSSHNGNGDEPYVVVQKQPPKYVYSNESFGVSLHLEVPKTASPLHFSFGGQGIELVASLYNDNNGRECGSEALLITEPSRIVMEKDRAGLHKCDVVCMIRMDSIRRDTGASLSVHFKPRAESSPPARGIAGTATTSIKLVNYKIRITLEDDWGPVWYKDEGGRDKSMEIYAAIYDKDGQVKTGEQIPLHPMLCYELPGSFPAPCSNQEILRTLGASRTVIDKDTGRARIRFRVEDVSKNHQAQDFTLMVGPDPKAKGFQDIAPDYTPAVNVRSKRNKRSRNPGTTSRASSDPSRRTSPTAMRARYEDQQDSTSVFESADVPRLREALRSVINWADEVVNGLYPLQWQVLGYAQHPDGATDYSRPYHNMPNPNPCISRVLAMYTETVREDLRVLLNSIEQASLRFDDSASLMPIPIPVAEPRAVGEERMYGSMMRSPQSNSMHGPHGMPPPGMSRRAPEHYQGAIHHEMPMYQARSSIPPHMVQQHQPMPPMHAYMRAPLESDMMPIHHGMPPRGEMPPVNGPGEIPIQRSLRIEEDSRESEVEYVLAKQYKALRTGERLGFPAYSETKEIIGFYREQPGGAARQFSPISRHRSDFGPLEILQATEILEDAIKKKSEAVHTLKDWGTIDNVLNQALVYDWRQDIGSDGPSP